MQQGEPAADPAIAEMARLSGTGIANYKGQLATTFL